MYCNNCGSKIEHGSKYCDNCGVRISYSGPLSSATGFLIGYGLIVKRYLTGRVLIVGGAILIAIFAGYKLWSSYEQAQSLLASQQQTLLTAQDEIKNLADSASTSAAMVRQEAAEASSSEALAKQAQAEVVTAAGATADVSLSSTLLKETMSRVVQVTCVTDTEISTGSGDVQGTNSGSWVVYTDLHVLDPASTNQRCEIGLPQPPTYTASETYPVTITEVGDDYPDVDFAELTPNDPTEQFQPYALSACTPNQINIGDEVTVFGYPADGGNSLTVTNGIVSGIVSTAYGYIYKTSANIDEGNSGGLALDDNSKCGIGMPTWAVEGKFEGLGYIQSWDMITNAGDL
ncbi:MAG TPA: trypsin-like peptidase domain-containing protein [Candidatus Paceibacterota bacterium]|nr:trypsin-like peptidase domain-containing protein [Candidatus Paceibacterota bacterium]